MKNILNIFLLIKQWYNNNQACIIFILILILYIGLIFGSVWLINRPTYKIKQYSNININGKDTIYIINTWCKYNNDEVGGITTTTKYLDSVKFISINQKNNMKILIEKDKKIRKQKEELNKKLENEVSN